MKKEDGDADAVREELYHTAAASPSRRGPRITAWLCDTDFLAAADEGIAPDEVDAPPLLVDVIVGRWPAEVEATSDGKNVPLLAVLLFSIR